MKRRQFLSAALAVTGAALASETVFAQEDDRIHIAVNTYTCGSFYNRDNADFWTRLDELKGVGVDGIEPGVGSAVDAENVGKRLVDSGMEMRSVYTGGNLHDPTVAEQNIARILALGEKVKSFGTSIITINPDAKSGKTDAELILQSKNLDILGAGLQKIGVSLAFHYHTSELEFGGREFHHVMCGTDPKNVALCFEQHWSYRGCGNSAVAMFDHLKLYGDRSVTAHIRQSINNVWSETYGDGDIDNVRLAAGFKKLSKMPHIVLEQAAEGATPKTLTAVEVFRQSVEYIHKVFG